MANVDRSGILYIFLDSRQAKGRDGEADEERIGAEFRILD